MESTISYGDPHASAGIQIVTYDMEKKSTPTATLSGGPGRSIGCARPGAQHDCVVEHHLHGGVLNQLRAEGYPVNDADVARLSPLLHEHVNMLGRYSFSVPDAVAKGGLRPLRDPADRDS